MFKILLIFLTIIFYKILANKFNISIQESLVQSSMSLVQSSMSLVQSKFIIQSKAKLMIMAYNIIYFYSVCQIKCNQLYNIISPYLEIFKNENNLIDDIQTQRQTIELFDLNTNKNTIFTEKEHQVFELIQSPNNLLIMSDLTNKNITNKKIVDKKNIDTCNSYFDMSKITFIALYLNYNDVRYNINLKTKEFNYYLVGNIINKQFVQYYINNILKLPFYYTKEQMVSYQLELMDQEVNIVCLNADQSIIIEKNNYRIVNDDNLKEKEEKEENKLTELVEKELVET
jgi:hypothetical protein